MSPAEQELPLRLSEATPVHALRLADPSAAQLQGHQGLFRRVSAPQEQNVAFTGRDTVDVVAHTVAEVPSSANSLGSVGTTMQ